MAPHPYIAGYPPEVVERAEAMLAAGELGQALAARYPERHQVRSNKELQKYVQELKAKELRTAAPLQNVTYDDKLRVLEGALGLHTTTTRTHGSKTKRRRSIRIASLFKDVAPEFLRMITVHELAHMKHADHDRDFYRLCTHIEPHYHQYELDLRLQLLVDERAGETLKSED